jgi:hypothetical protein
LVLSAIVPAKKKTKPKKKTPKQWLNMNDSALFARVDKVFEARTLPGLSLVLQVRLALNEWCFVQEARNSRRSRW